MSVDAQPAPVFSVCTLVTKAAEYEAMRSSFVANGFTEQITEYLIQDNSAGNARDAYDAINAFLLDARGETIILCHQDVVLLQDGAQRLRGIVAEMTTRYPDWAVLGNAGATASGRLCIRISDPHGSDQKRGDALPAEVVSVDENFIVVRRAANLALSRDVGGFHFYGADLCIMADVLGWRSFVVDFHLQHNSAGRADGSFHDVRRLIERKYARAFRARWIHGTMIFPIYLASNRSKQVWASQVLRLQKMLGLRPRRAELSRSR